MKPGGRGNFFSVFVLFEPSWKLLLSKGAFSFGQKRAGCCILLWMFIVRLDCLGLLSLSAVCRLLGGIPAQVSLRLCRVAAMGCITRANTSHRVFPLFYETGAIL